MKILKQNCIAGLILLFIFVLLFSSCKKNSSSSNTSTTPVNTKGNLIVWSDNASVGNINGVSRSIDVLLDNNYKGAITIKYVSAPSCGAGGCVNLELEAGNYQLKMLGPFANQESNGYVTIKAGECLAFRAP